MGLAALLTIIDENASGRAGGRCWQRGGGRFGGTAANLQGARFSAWVSKNSACRSRRLATTPIRGARARHRVRHRREILPICASVAVASNNVCLGFASIATARPRRAHARFDRGLYKPLDINRSMRIGLAIASTHVPAQNPMRSAIRVAEAASALGMAKHTCRAERHAKRAIKLGARS